MIWQVVTRKMGRRTEFQAPITPFRTSPKRALDKKKWPNWEPFFFFYCMVLFLSANCVPINPRKLLPFSAFCSWTPSNIWGHEYRVRVISLVSDIQSQYHQQIYIYPSSFYHTLKSPVPDNEGRETSLDNGVSVRIVLDTVSLSLGGHSTLYQ